MKGGRSTTTGYGVVPLPYRSSTIAQQASDVLASKYGPTCLPLVGLQAFTTIAATATATATAHAVAYGDVRSDAGRGADKVMARSVGAALGAVQVHGVAVQMMCILP